MKRTMSLACLCLLALGLSRCDEDEVLTQSAPAHEFAAIARVASGQLIPVLRQIDLIRVFQGVPIKAAQSEACSPIEACSAGTWEYCERPKGFDYAFDGCLLDGDLLQGTLSSAGSGVAGTVAYDLTVGPLSYQGFVTFAQDGDCIDESLTEFRADGPPGSLDLVGELSYCSTSGFPTGALDLVATDPGGGVGLPFSARFDGTPQAVIAVGAGASFNCSVDLVSGATFCG